MAVLEECSKEDSLELQEPNQFTAKCQYLLNLTNAEDTCQCSGMAFTLQKQTSLRMLLTFTSGAMVPHESCTSLFIQAALLFIVLVSCHDYLPQNVHFPFFFFFF